jgi:hypothetical protein
MCASQKNAALFRALPARLHFTPTEMGQGFT